MFDHGTWMFGGWFTVILIWLIPFLVVYLLLADRFKGRTLSARETLDQAYASGRLSRDEYLKKRADIDSR